MGMLFTKSNASLPVFFWHSRCDIEGERKNPGFDFETYSQLQFARVALHDEVKIQLTLIKKEKARDRKIDPVRFKHIISCRHKTEYTHTHTPWSG